MNKELYDYAYITVFEYDIYKATNYEFVGSWLVMYDVIECEAIEFESGGVSIEETDCTHSVLGIHANTMVRIQHIRYGVDDKDEEVSGN